MKKNKLIPTQLYWLKDLEKMEIKICRLGINRNLNDKEVEKKVKSFSQVKRVLVPGLLVECKKCLEEGLEVYREDGTPVKSTDPDLERSYVLIDGAHRNAAVKKYNKDLLKNYHSKAALETSSERKEQLKTEYEKSIIDMEFRILETDKLLADVLKEVNVSVYLWKGGDYLTQILAFEEKDKKYIDYTSLKWVKELQGKIGDTAAWLWRSLGGRAPTKSELVKAGSDANKRFELAKPGDFEYGKAIYESAVKVLPEKTMNLKCIPELMGEWLQELAHDKSKKEACECIVKFFELTTREQFTPIGIIKKSETETKDQIIRKHLNSLWKLHRGI